MRNPFGGSIAGQLRLYSLALLLPLTILGGIILYQAWVTRPQMALENAAEMAREGSHQVDAFMTRTGAVLAALAHLREGQGLRVGEATQILQELNDQFPEYQGLFLTDAQGRVLASSPFEGVGMDVGDRSYFQEAMATGQVAVSGLLTSRLTGGPIVIVAYPVVGRNGQSLGIAAADVDLGYLPLSLSRVRLDQGYHLTIFSPEGQVVAGAAPLGEAMDASLCTRCHAAPAPKGGLDSRTWVGDGEFHALATTSQGWRVVVNAPSSQILGSVQRDAWGVLAFVGVILAGSLLLARLTGIHLARPILRLAEGARRFGAEGAVGPLPVTGRDEVGALTEDFNRMVGEIGEGRRLLEERQAQLGVLHALDRSVSSTLSLPALLDVSADQVQGLAGVEGVVVYLLQGDEALTLASSRGLGTRLAQGEAAVDLEALAWRTAESYGLRGLETPLQRLEGEALGQKAWCLAAPLVSKDRSLGAILFFTDQPQGFSPVERDFLSTVALQVSTAVENALLYEAERRRAAELEALTQALKEHGERLQQAQEGIVETLNLSLQAKDPYTRGHADRVALLSRRIATRLGLPPERRALLVRAARLHDIGKIAIPEHLLNKEGPLTPAERADFQLHPERSADLLRHLPDLGQVLPAIRAHHERYDGKGYPDGLAGEEIPLEARIIAVADGYDALTTDRPYRPALSHEEALKVLKAHAGAQWDPPVVQAVLDTFQEEGELEGR